DAPALVVALVAGIQQPQDLDDRVAVGAEQLLRELDACRPAVALDLLFVGVELHPPYAAGGQPRRSDGEQRRQDVLAKTRRIAVKAHAKVLARVSVADEKPAVGCAGGN